MYLTRHPSEHGAVEPLLTLLEGAQESTSRATMPAHITCSAVVIDRDRRVLHIHHRASGLVLVPGGHLEPEDRTLLAAAVREVGEEAGIKAGDLCLTPQLLGIPIDIDFHDIEARPGKGEPPHRHYDVRFVFYLVGEHPELVLQDAEVAGAEWRHFDAVSSPTLRAKLLDSGLDGRPEAVSASALIFNDAGRYLLHLRDDLPGIWEPGAFALLGGGSEPQDVTLEDTVRRELGEEVPDLVIPDLEPFAVERATGSDGLCVPIQVFAGRWNGDPDRLRLTEGILLRWFAPEMLHRLRLSPATRTLLLRHATQRSALLGQDPRYERRDDSEEGPLVADQAHVDATVPGARTGGIPRLAVPADAGEIARLRSELILSEPLDGDWLSLCRDHLAARLVPGGDARAYVVDAPEGGLASCALALVDAVLPAPRYPKGLAARIQAVATVPDHRRRGYAKAVLTALLAHLEGDGVTLYELHASDESAPLYAALGFTRDPALMRMTRIPSAAHTAAHAT
ncbi:bifunctional NUDIX hydrolase family protein/GNAT family N-acetyltransferase [Streptomyces sp. TLI_55]|uniref:bifunctional NUDIX hydrolase family protein/GNAT family N-acetyltransferase n=1 Tax=Streptomyces sp. TLI_55 TaxID=1938861 RepID=UPI00211BA981|nr:bifunctional NUDIX hydrolase family protein/GNAT family N-acetyltransferase [Streptomyces sp. TLI_55]